MEWCSSIIKKMEENFRRFHSSVDPVQLTYERSNTCQGHLTDYNTLVD